MGRPTPADSAAPRPGLARRVAFRAALVAGGLVAALLLLELALRVLPEPDGYASRMRAFAAGAVRPDPQLHHRLAPGADVTVAGIRYRFSALGTRGEPVTGDVLVVGDSVTLGWGVAEDQAYPAALGRQLRRRVVNAGVVGYGVEQAAAWLDELLPQVSPRLVVVGYFPNDPEAPGASSELAGPGWSRLWRLLRPPLRGLAARLGWAASATEHHRALHAEGSAGWRRVEAGLARIAARCRARALPCFVALLPQLTQDAPGEPYALSEEHARLATLGRGLGLHVVDLAPALYAAGRDLRGAWVAPDDSHPAAALHAIYAEHLARALRGWL